VIVVALLIVLLRLLCFEAPRVSPLKRLASMLSEAISQLAAQKFEFRY
jgi:hypothetical protein